MSHKRRAAAAVLWTASAVAMAAAAAALIAFYPPPSTFASLYPPQSPDIRPSRFTRSVCNGVQCKLCPYDCFLPEGARGVCIVRVNYGGKVKTLTNSRPAVFKAARD